MKAIPRSRYVLFVALALLGLGLDLGTKAWIFARQGMPYASNPIWVVRDILSLDTNLNEGALFGMGQGNVPVFAALSVCAALAICYWLFLAGAAHDRWLTVCLGLILGGILGNLYDRLGLPGLTWNYPPERVGEPVHAVRDWIHFQIEGLVDWPVFNVADSLLVCGVTLLVWHTYRHPAPRPEPQPASAK
jgi:signal peptidase II